MKKFFVKALTMLITVSMLAACGGGGGETTKAGEGGEGEKIELRFTSWQSNFKEVDQKAAEEYNKLNPNVTVKFEYFGDQNSAEYDKKIDLMVLGNESIDIAMTSDYVKYSTRANAGNYVAMNDFIKEEGLNYEDTYAIDPKIGDTYYSIPGDWKSWVVILNKNMLDEAGLPVPPLDWTWDDFAEYSKKLTGEKDGKTVHGSYFHTWITYDIFGMTSTKMNTPLYLEEDKTALGEPVWRNWLEFRKKMDEDGLLTPYKEVKAMKMSYRDVFLKGECAMLPIGTWMLSEVSEVEKYPHDFVTTFAPLPTWSKDGGQPGRTYTEAHYYVIPKTSKNPKAAYDFIRWYTNEGLELRGVSIPATKDADKVAGFKKMITDEKLVDLEAMEAVLNNPKWEDNIDTSSPTYALEMQTMVLEECDLYFLDNQDLDTTINNLVSRANKIIEDSKK